MQGYERKIGEGNLIRLVDARKVAIDGGEISYRMLAANSNKATYVNYIIIDRKNMRHKDYFVCTFIQECALTESLCTTHIDEQMFYTSIEEEFLLKVQDDEEFVKKDHVQTSVHRNAFYFLAVPFFGKENVWRR